MIPGTDAVDPSICPAPSRKVPLNVMLFTNMIAPYSLPTLRKLTASLQRLQVFISVAMEPNRQWEARWDGVGVAVQRSFMIRRVLRYKQGYSMEVFKHFPYDSLLLLYKYRPDVNISTELGFRTMQAAGYRLLNPGSRLIIWADLSEHTEREVTWTRKLMRRVFLRCADAVIVNGSSAKRYVQSLGVPEKRIVVVPQTTELSGFRAVPIDKKRLTARRLLYVGQLEERKGLEAFMRALASWAQRNAEHKCEMWIVGDGPVRTNLEQWALPPNISLQFFGSVAYHRLPEYYAQAGVLVLPTLADTWGLVVNEGMAAGLPVLGSLYSQAVQDLVRDNFNGWTFHADHPEELDNALGRALSTPLAILSQMREAARQTVIHLNPDFAAGKILQAINLATKSNRAATVSQALDGHGVDPLHRQVGKNG